MSSSPADDFDIKEGEPTRAVNAEAASRSEDRGATLVMHILNRDINVMGDIFLLER